MPVKIEPYTSFEEALKQSGALAFETVMMLLNRMPPNEVLELLMARVLAARGDAEKLIVLLQLIRKQLVVACVAEYAERPFRYASQRERAAEMEAVVRFRAYLDQLFWQLPDSRRQTLYAMEQDGSRYEDGHTTLQALPEVKLFIFRELLPEWTAEPTAKSVYAFRRAIAMGWPLPSQFTAKFDGEDDVELRARGRRGGPDGAKQYVNAVRTHLEGFASFEERRKGADALYGPWLAQQRVPEDIEKLLVIARAKMGGPDTARRDLRYAATMHGLPVSSELILATTADRMRTLLGDAQSVIDALIAKLGERYPRYDARRNLPRSIEFVSPNYIVIDIGGANDAEDIAVMFGDTVHAIGAARAGGAFQESYVELRVRSRYEDGPPPLQRVWAPNEH
jgi:hypothetical protein